MFRNEVERTFGVMKNRFAVLKGIEYLVTTLIKSGILYTLAWLSIILFELISMTMTMIPMRLLMKLLLSSLPTGKLEMLWMQ
jgi:hypothetical protein